jgi:hypothetical protein
MREKGMISALEPIQYKLVWFVKCDENSSFSLLFFNISGFLNYLPSFLPFDDDKYSLFH